MGYHWRGFDELLLCSLKHQALWWALWNRANIVERKFRRHTQSPVFAFENKLSSVLLYGRVYSSVGNTFSRFLSRMVEKFTNRLSPMLVPKANNGVCGILALSSTFRRKFSGCGLGVYFSVFLQPKFTMWSLCFETVGQNWEKICFQRRPRWLLGSRDWRLAGRWRSVVSRENLISLNEIFNRAHFSAPFENNWLCWMSLFSHLTSKWLFCLFSILKFSVNTL